MTRRTAAILIAMVLALPMSAHLAPAADVDLAKLSPAMRQLVAQGGYKDPAAFAKLVSSVVRGDVYYLAQIHGGIDADAMSALRAAGARVRLAFPEISWVALSSRIDAVAKVSRLARVSHLEVDGVQRLLSTNIQFITAASLRSWGDQHKRGTADVGADELWKAGVDGTGITLGVADSGVDSTHPDLDNLDWRRWDGAGAAKTSFVDCTPSLALGDIATIAGQTIGLNPPDVCTSMPGYDDNGHGTHVSGIATGTAQGLMGQEGLYPGMAPGALLQVAKVCSAAGTCLNSSVMAGMRYLALEKSQGGAGADVINMSLGGSRFYGAPLFGAQMETNADAEDQLVNTLSQIHNVLFVIAAGNSGPVLGSVSNPATASQSLAVGASVADFDLNHPTDQTLHGEFGDVVPNAPRNGAIGIAGFSSRGPSGDRLVKPDVVAPGVYVVAPQALTGGEIAAGDLAHRNNFSADPTYAVLSGTSMASPSAAGVAALVASGYKKVFGSIPTYYRLKAALANTAGGSNAYEGSVVGLIFGTLARNGVIKPEDYYHTRNKGFIGITGTGAGRVDAPNALFALTRGVIAYTPQVGKLNNIHELQPSWAMDDLAPGGSSSTTFALHGAPKMPATAAVTFRMATDHEPAGMFAAPASWFTLPHSVTSARASDVPVRFGLDVPANAKPGAYEAMILGTVHLGSIEQTIRIPVQFFVRLVDRKIGVGGTSTEGPIWASGTTDYSIVGSENPEADITTDWTMIPLAVAKGTKRVDFSVYDVAGKDHMDVFVFDAKGNEIDSSVTSNVAHAVPEGALYFPTDKAGPSKVTIIGDSPDGNDTSDLETIHLPTTVWIAVSDSGPANAPSMSRYHLDVDEVAGAPTPAASPIGGGVLGDSIAKAGSRSGTSATSAVALRGASSSARRPSWPGITAVLLIGMVALMLVGRRRARA